MPENIESLSENKGASDSPPAVSKEPIRKRPFFAHSSKIGICGFRAVGKTTYLTVLFETLRVGSTFQLQATDPSTRATMTDYYCTLADKQQFLPPTLAEAPLNFEVILNKKNRFYFDSLDYAGELVSLAKLMEQMKAAEEFKLDKVKEAKKEVVGFLVDCDCMLFFMDPGSTRNFRMLREQQGTFTEIMRQIFDYRGHFHVPIALIITKADLIPGFKPEYARLIPHEDEYVKSLGFKKVREYVEKRYEKDPIWQQSILGIVDNLQEFLESVTIHTLDFQVFFSSPLGSVRKVMEEGKEVTRPPEKINPIGLEDPLRWCVENLIGTRQVRLWKKATRVLSALLVVLFISLAICLWWNLRLLREADTIEKSGNQNWTDLSKKYHGFQRHFLTRQLGLNNMAYVKQAILDCKAIETSSREARTEKALEKILQDWDQYIIRYGSLPLYNVAVEQKKEVVARLDELPIQEVEASLKQEGLSWEESKRLIAKTQRFISQFMLKEKVRNRLLELEVAAKRKHDSILKSMAENWANNSTEPIETRLKELKQYPGLVYFEKDEFTDLIMQVQREQAKKDWQSIELFIQTNSPINRDDKRKAVLKKILEFLDNTPDNIRAPECNKARGRITEILQEYLGEEQKNIAMDWSNLATSPHRNQLPPKPDFLVQSKNLASKAKNYLLEFEYPKVKTSMLDDIAQKELELRTFVAAAEYDQSGFSLHVQALEEAKKVVKTSFITEELDRYISHVKQKWIEFGIKQIETMRTTHPNRPDLRCRYALDFLEVGPENSDSVVKMALRDAREYIQSEKENLAKIKNFKELTLDYRRFFAELQTLCKSKGRARFADLDTGLKTMEDEVRTAWGDASVEWIRQDYRKIWETYNTRQRECKLLCKVFDEFIQPHEPDAGIHPKIAEYLQYARQYQAKTAKFLSGQSYQVQLGSPSVTCHWFKIYLDGANLGQISPGGTIAIPWKPGQQIDIVCWYTHQYQVYVVVGRRKTGLFGWGSGEDVYGWVPASTPKESGRLTIPKEEAIWELHGTASFGGVSLPCTIDRFEEILPHLLKPF